MEEFVEFFGFHAEEGFAFVDFAFVDEVGGDFDHGAAGAFAASGLEDPEAALLDGSLPSGDSFDPGSRVEWVGQFRRSLAEFITRAESLTPRADFDPAAPEWMWHL